MADLDGSALTTAQAAAVVAAFFSREGLRVTEQGASELGTPGTARHPDLGPLVTFRGKLGQIWVSPRANVVYYAGDALPAPQTPPDAAHYLEVARHFAERHVAEFAARNYALEPFKADQTTLTVRWTEKPRAGRETAIYPNWVEVQLQLPSGRVSRFNASDLRLVRRTPPRLSESQARVAIRARFDKSAIEEIELMELPAPGPQSSITVWTARVMTLAPEGPVTQRVTIDADSGQLIPE